MNIEDEATSTEELFRKAALSHRNNVLQNVGACYNCGEMCNGAFCSGECREDYEQRKRFNRGGL